MEKRKYTKLRAIEPEITAMREAGKTHREIAEHFGLEKGQVMWWVSKYNRKQAELAAGRIPRAKGRPRKDSQSPRQREQKEIERLRRANRLLRDFLELRERKWGQRSSILVIYRHREEYPVSVICRFLGVSRSGYYGFIQRIGQPEADAELAEAIETCQTCCGRTYGYRRVWLWLRQRNIHRNPKTVLRIMKNAIFWLRFAAVGNDYRWGSRYTSSETFSTETSKRTGPIESG